MKTFNVKLAAILLVSGLVFLVGVYFWHGHQVYASAGFFLDLAKVAEDKAADARKSADKPAERKAIQDRATNLAWFLRLAPRDPRALDVSEVYGLLMADNLQTPGAFGAATDTLERVVRTDAERSKARRKVIDLWMGVGRFIDARPHIMALLEKKPDDPEMLQRLGQCQAVKGEKNQAKASYLAAIKYSPTLVEAYFQLAVLLQEHPELCDRIDPDKEKTDDAVPDDSKEKVVEHTPESVLKQMIEKNPGSAKANVYMARYLLVTKNALEGYKSALEYAQKAIELDASDHEALILAAQCCMALQQFDDVRKYAKMGLEKEKDVIPFRAVMYSILAEAEYRTKNREQAMKILTKAYGETKSPQFIWLQADWQLDANDLAGAKDSIEKLAALNYDNRGLEYLRGRIALSQRKWAEASRSLEAARAFFTTRPHQAKLVEYWLSVCYGQLRNSDQQIAALERALSIDPFFEAAVVDLALAKQRAQGVQTMSLKSTLSIIENTKDPRSLLTLIPMAINAKRQLPKDEQNWPQLEELLDAAQKKFPDLAELPLLRCEILLVQERYDDAEKTLRGLLSKNAKYPPYWRALITLMMQQKKMKEAEETLAQFEKAVGDTLDLRVMKASFYVRQYGKDAQPRLQALTEHTEGYNDQQKMVLLGTIQNAMREIGARDASREILKHLAEQDPNNIQYLILNFDQANEAGDLKRMEKILDDMERVEGHGPYWLYSQAVLRNRKAIASKDPALAATLLDEASQLLEQAKEQRGNWQKIPFLTGQIYDQKGDTQRALKYYQDAVDLGEYHPLAVTRIVEILWQQQHVREANEFFRRLEREQIQFTLGMMKLWVAVLMDNEIHDFDTALEKARRVSALALKDYKDALWFGHVLSEIARQKKAAGDAKAAQAFAPEQEKAFRRAVELNPAIPDTWVALMGFQVANDQLTEAEKTFEEARKKFVGKEAPLALAQCLEMLKKYPQAKEQYQLALAGAPKDPQTTRKVAEFFIRMGGSSQADLAADVKQAEALLNRLIEGKEVKSEKDDVLWARRAMARILLTRSGYENTDKARQLVEQNLKTDPNSAPDKSLFAYINSRDPKESNRTEAIRAYKELNESQKATDADRFSLTQLYLSNKDWLKASEILRQLAVDSNNDPQFLAIYIHELLNHAEVSDAEVYLQRLQDKWPNHVQTVLLQAELMVRHNKAEEALDLMKSFVDRPNAVPADRTQRIRLMALAMEDFVQRVLGAAETVDRERYVRTAELFQRQYTDEHPSSAMEVVAFLARQRRFDDAADMFEQNWKNSDPASIHQAAMLVCEEGRGLPDVVKRVLKILEEAKATFENHPTILLATADIGVGIGDYDRAEAIYRDILKDNAGHAVAMNNLAVLLTVTRKDAKEALKLINQAITITGPLAQMLDTRACVYIALQQADKAMADMKDVIADGKQPSRLFHQAQALELAGQDNAAAVAMEEALQMGLTEKDLLKPEANAFQRLRDKAHALSPAGKGSGKK